MSNNMTFKRQFENYRPNEYINAVKLVKETEFTMITEPNDYDDWLYDNVYVRPILPPEQFVTGSIIDRLAAYERTYMEPEEIIDMKADNGCMKDKIKVLEKEVEAWKKANEALKKERSDLKKELKEAKQEIQKWVDHRQELRIEYDKLEKENHRLYEKNGRLETLELENETLKDELAEVKWSRDVCRKDIELLKTNLNNLDGPRKYFEEKCALLEKENESKNEEIENLRSTIGCKDFTIKDLNEEWDKCAERIKELRKENEELKAKQNGYTKRFLNCIYGSPFRGGSIYPKFPVDINDLIAKLREYKDIMVSVSQYDDSVTVNVTPWTPVEEKETSFQNVTDVRNFLEYNLSADKFKYTIQHNVQDKKLNVCVEEQK